MFRPEFALRPLIEQTAVMRLTLNLTLSFLQEIAICICLVNTEVALINQILGKFS